MIRKIDDDPTLLNLCLDMFKRLEDKSTRRECIDEVLESKFEGKMSEADYLHYRFLKVLNEMYREGFYAGQHFDSFQPEQPQRSVTESYHAPKRHNKTSSSESYAIQLAPVIKNIRSGGARTFQEIADELTGMKIKTISGQEKWYPATVRRLEAHIATCTIEFKIGVS